MDDVEQPAEVNPDGTPVASYEYGHVIDREERSAEVYRIGGLHDVVDAWAITEQVLKEVGLPPESAERLARSIFARLGVADGGGIQPCRLTEVKQPEPDGVVPTPDPPRNYPAEVFLSKAAGQWPITAVEGEDQAARLLLAPDVTAPRRSVWRCRVEYLEEMVLVPPTPATLRPKGAL